MILLQKCGIYAIMIILIIRILKMSINAKINVIQAIAIFKKILIIKWFVKNNVNKAKQFIKIIQII